MNRTRFPGPRWLHAGLCLALAIVAAALAFAVTAAITFRLQAGDVPMRAAFGLTGVLAAAVLSPYLGGPRMPLWGQAILFGLSAGSICVWIGLGGRAYV